MGAKHPRNGGEPRERDKHEKPEDRQARDEEGRDHDRAKDDEVESASKDSLPASDPPSW